MSMNSPLRLEDYNVVEFHLEASGTPPGDSANVALQHGYQLQPHKTERRKFRLELSVGINRDAETISAYRGSVRVEGFFEVDPEFPADKAEALSRVNGASILYGFVRDLVRDFTGQSRHGRLTLPTVSFASLANDASKPSARPARKKKPAARKETK